MEHARPSAARIASVDALRGLTVAAMLLVNTPGDWGHVYAPLRHANWHGVTPTDLVFPFFLFIVGVSIALVPPPAHQKARAAVPVLARAARIAVLGLALHLLAFVLLNQPEFRPWGVLQRIGVCYAAAGLVWLVASVRTQWTLIVLLLIGYWLILATTGGYAPFDNLASRIDAALLGPHAYMYEPASGRGHDPEGLLSTLPAIATTLIGLRAGDWLRTGADRRLWIVGAAFVGVGLVWSTVMPLNKNLWTSSYAVFSAGCAMLALALAHDLIDRRGWPALGRSFGRNAIVAYAGSAALVYGLMAIGVWDDLYRVGFLGLAPALGASAASALFALAFVAFWGGVVLAMERMGWRVRI